MRTERPGSILTIVGPAGSGKTTLARRWATTQGWQHVEEDAYWVRNAFGTALRTLEQEDIVRGQVLAELDEIVGRGQNVVLDLILYREPPNPLTAYLDALQSRSVQVDVVALRPTVAEILERMMARGRASDLADMPGRGVDAEHQVAVLDGEPMRSCVVDSTHMSVDDLVEHCRRITSRA